MAILKRVAPGSAFRVGLIVYGIMGLVLGAFCTLVSVFASRLAPHAHVMMFGWAGVFAVVLCPIIYGLIGGIGGAIAAWLYNLASGWVGGLEVDLG